MTAFRMLTVNCDGSESPAGRSDHCEFYVQFDRETVTVARRALHKGGWSYDAEEKLDLCPACTERRSAAPKDSSAASGTAPADAGQTAGGDWRTGPEAVPEALR